MSRWLAGLWLLLVAEPLSAQKTDVLVMQNGDRITGEVKGLSRGKLDYSTDDAGSMSVEWNKVARLTSPAHYEVELRDGRKVFGTLTDPEKDRQLAITDSSTISVGIDEVVGMTPIQEEFWARLQGHLDVGLTYAKANDNIQLTSSGLLRYRGTSVEVGFDFNSYLQSQNNQSTVSHVSVGAGVQWFVAPLWMAGALAQLQQNDELDLALRTTIGAVATRTLVQSQRAIFRVPAGVVLNREEFYGTDTVTVSVEALLGAELATFRFDSPKVDISASTYGYPSLTESGRFRLEAEARVRYEIFKDFFFGLSFVDSYDSKPPKSGTATNDLTTALSIGWSFHE